MLTCDLLSSSDERIDTCYGVSNQSRYRHDAIIGFFQPIRSREQQSILFAFHDELIRIVTRQKEVKSDYQNEERKENRPG